LARVVSCFFFFSSRRRHTRFDCDWSSDVCSSDLGGGTDGFFALLSPVGRFSLSTYLGGSGDDRALAVAADAAGTGFYVAGETRRSEERRVGKECRSRGSPDH